MRQKKYNKLLLLFILNLMPLKEASQDRFFLTWYCLGDGSCYKSLVGALGAQTGNDMMCVCHQKKH